MKKDDEKDKNFEILGDEALEARVVAWVLGEASDFEAEELKRLCEEQPELEVFRRRIEAVHGLAGEAMRAPLVDWKLPPQKRAKVLALMETPRERPEASMKEKTKRHFGRRALLGLAACLLLGFFLVPVVLKQRKHAGFVESNYRSEGGEMADLSMMSEVSAELDEVAPQPVELEVRSGSMAKSMPPSAPLIAADAPEAPPALAKNMPSAPPIAADVSGAPPALAMRNRRAGEMHRGFVNEESSVRPNGAKSNKPVPAAKPKSGMRLQIAGSALALGKVDENGRTRPERSPVVSVDSLAVLDEDGESGAGGGGGASDKSHMFDRSDKFDDLGRELETVQGRIESKSMQRAEPRKDAQMDAKTPEQALDLRVEVSTAKDPYSTFSLHVGDASFRIAAAALARGERPAPEKIRPEEFYNAFDYGDPAPGAGEPVACAVEQCRHPVLPGRNLVRIAVRVGSAGRAAGQPLHLTILLDNSGSMEREDRRAALRAAIRQLASLLGPNDVVSVIGFSRTPHLLADRMDGAAAKKALPKLVTQTPAEGGTNLEAALALAAQVAGRSFQSGAQNRIVLLTDGAANLGNADPESLARRIEQLRRRGIAFDAAGFGTAGMNDAMLERLARDGNGRYYVVDSVADAGPSFAAKLAGAFRPAAENVKVQVRFNPQRVGRYRLIGFEKHRLAKEDFRNDAVDAAELAAEEAGVALYQVELLPEGEGEIGEVAVRFRAAGAGKMVERSWTLPYDESVPPFDQASPSMQLAGLAMLVASDLRDGPLAPLTDWRELAPVVARVKAEYGAGKNVAELIEMVSKIK